MAVEALLRVGGCRTSYGNQPVAAATSSTYCVPPGMKSLPAIGRLRRSDAFLRSRFPDEAKRRISAKPSSRIPFKLAERFVARALLLCPRVIMLLRLAFLRAKRRDILDNGWLARVYAFRKRLAMMHRSTGPDQKPIAEWLRLDCLGSESHWADRVPPSVVGDGCMTDRLDLARRRAIWAKDAPRMSRSPRRRSPGPVSTPAAVQAGRARAGGQTASDGRDQRAVAAAYGIEFAELLAPRREAVRSSAANRDVSIFKIVPVSLPQIGRRFGDRDHTTCCTPFARLN